ncbi:kinase domain protein (macronuclear) [Tetrahymena thermophila SB210]|uniref:Kinase domain protein n=1 Tax=Tetrahymena thermophila (strain SB210) TaxID=312017 RepID=W7XD30_TETTS|nr:kinase domain protein [Tetrahymena thermophila SB210]EWS71721.1 kinase domain protein [Tetrahymena thermophila SB210]|eukprot:XP_012655742.1 kinase domain protein [Tetrahymena thermophila SB210]
MFQKKSIASIFFVFSFHKKKIKIKSEIEMIIYIDFNQENYLQYYIKKEVCILIFLHITNCVSRIVDKQIVNQKRLIQLNCIKNSRKVYLGIEQLKKIGFKEILKVDQAKFVNINKIIEEKMILENIQNQFFNILKILVGKTTTLEQIAMKYELIYKLLQTQTHSDQMSSLHFQSCKDKDQFFKIIQSSEMLKNLRIILQLTLIMPRLKVQLNKLAERITHLTEIKLCKIDSGLPFLHSRINGFQAKDLNNKQYKASAAQLQLYLTIQNCYVSPYQKKDYQYQITILKMKNNKELSHEILKENVKLNYQNSYCFLKEARQVRSKAVSKTNSQFSVDQQQPFNKENDTELIIQQNKYIINKLSQPKLNKLRNALLIGQKARIIKILQKENKISNKNKSLLFGGGKNIKNIDSDQKTIPKKNRKEISSLINTNVEMNKIKVELNENQNEQNNSNTQQAEYDELNKELEQFFKNWPKYIEIIDSSLKMKKQKILDEQKGQQPQRTTIISQSSQKIFQQSDQGIYISKSNTSCQFGQKGVERYQSLKDFISTKQYYEENKKNQPIQKKKNLDYDSEQFLRQIFKLGDHINSGGEADIFTNQNYDYIVYRVIKLNGDEDLRKQEKELLRLQELQEQNIFNIDSSHLIEDKINHTKYIIYVMQKCKMSLQDEILSKKVFSLRETLKFISTSFHLLIVLRQKYIYHSDIKPGNILKIDDNNYQLSDFGASQYVDFIDPFCDFEMYTPSFTPQKKEKNLPFYHDIYSFGKTIQKLLIQLENQSEISDELNKFIKEICKDDENSINLDCFKLQRKFINILMEFTNDEVIKAFFEEYLKQIEQYLVIKKENRVFQYESQYIYAEIALLIILKSQFSNQQSQLTSIKIKAKALITQSYILCKRKQYKESLKYINEIFREDFNDNSQSEILIKSIRIVTKILIKLNNKIKLSQENQNKLIDLIKLANIGEEFDKLKIKITELLLLKSDHIYPIITDFYDTLKIQLKNQEFDMVYRIIIKLIRYLRKQNCYDQSLYKLIQFIQNDQTNKDSYYKQKLLKEMGFYLYKFLFQRDEQLDIKLFVKYEKEMLLLPQIIYNCLNDLKLKSNLQIQFDKSIWQLYSIFIKLQELNIYSFDECKDILDNLEKIYKIIMVKIKKDNQLPYQEYDLYNKLNYYEKYLKRNNIKNYQFFNEVKNYQFFNEDEIRDKEKQIIQSINLFQQNNLNKNIQNQNLRNNEICQNKKETISLLNFIPYFESEQISLKYIGSLEKYNEEVESFDFDLNFYNIIQYHQKNLHEKKKIFEEITNLNIEIQDEYKNKFSYQFEKEESLTLRIYEFNDNSLLNNRFFTFLTQDLRKVQALKFKYQSPRQTRNFLQALKLKSQSPRETRNFLTLDKYNQNFMKTKILKSITKLTLDYSEQRDSYQEIIDNNYFKDSFEDFNQMYPRITELNIICSKRKNDLQQGLQDIFSLFNRERKPKSLNFELKFKDNEMTKYIQDVLKKIIKFLVDQDCIKISLQKITDIELNINFEVLKEFRNFEDIISNIQKPEQNLDYIKREYLFQEQSQFTLNKNDAFKILEKKFCFIISDITEDYLDQSKNITQLNITSSWQNIYTSTAQNIAQYLQTKQQNQYKLNLIVQGSQLFNEDQFFQKFEQINKYVQNHVLSFKQNKESIEIEQLDLHLDFNIICLEAATVIKNMLHKFKSNIKLNHNFNSCKIFDFETFMSSTDKPVNILKIDLSQIEKDIQEAQEIARTLAKCQNASSLSFKLYSLMAEQKTKIIANSLEKFEEITELSLSLSNKIGIQGAKYILNTIKHFRKVTQLDIDLSQNNIKDEGANILARFLEKFENMTDIELDLAGNDISSEGAKNISNALKKCNKITVLKIDFDDNQIDGEGFNNVINIIFKCQKITNAYLNFNFNKIDENVSLNIENKDEKSHNITQFNLYLRYNTISIQQAQNIIHCLKRFNNLQKLILHLPSNLGKDQIYKIQNFLQNCQSLTEIILNLTYTEISFEGKKNNFYTGDVTHLNIQILDYQIISEGIISIINAQEKCQRIRNLNFNLGKFELGSEILASYFWNSENISELKLQFDGVWNKKDIIHLHYNLQNISSQIEKLQNLTRLDLAFLRSIINDKGAYYISRAFEKCQKITQLQLNFWQNYITDKGAQEIASAIKKFQNITNLLLNLSKNYIQDEGAQSISNSLEKCQNITKLNLYLSGNQIQDKGAQSISNSLEKCQNITELHLNLTKNKISEEGINNLKMALERDQRILRLKYNL